MRAVSRPRGPLPARVYWVRRVLLLSIVALLVGGIGHVVGGGADRDSTQSATPAAGPTELASTPAATPSAEPRQQGKRQQGRKKLAVPTGRCADSDVSVVPAVAGPAYAGRDVTLTLRLRTKETAACTWEVSSQSVVLKVTSGSDRIWSTQDCPRAVPTQAVIIRKAQPTKVEVTWPGRRSDEDCSRNTGWALRGYYHATAAAFGAEPASQQFQLHSPPARTITPTPTPSPRADPTAGASPAADASPSPSPTPDQQKRD